MKVIDLLNKIANGEEVPRKVKYKTYYWEYKQENKDYKDNEDDWVFSCSNYDIPEMLNNEIEILEEDKKEKKIPEKLDIEQDTPTSNYYIRNEYGTKCGLTKHSKIIADKINQIIDYLKSKGE